MKKPNLYSNLCMYNTNNHYARSREDVALYSEYSLGNCSSRPLPQPPLRQPLLASQSTPNIYDIYGGSASENESATKAKTCCDKLENASCLDKTKLALLCLILFFLIRSFYNKFYCKEQYYQASYSNKNKENHA